MKNRDRGLSGAVRGSITTKSIPIGGFGGRGKGPPKQGARLSIGLKVDALRDLVGVRIRPGDPEMGSELGFFDRVLGRIREDAVQEFVRAERVEQVGEDAGATFTSTVGVFAASREPSIVIDILYFPSTSEPTFTEFEENVWALGERLALGFAQYAVLVETDDGKDRPALGQATPLGLPEPGPELEQALRTLRGGR